MQYPVCAFLARILHIVPKFLFNPTILIKKLPMKKLFFFVLFGGMLLSAKAQLVAKATCPPFEVDILDGKVNGLKANARIDDIKAKFPCFSASEAVGTTAKCGASVFYGDRDLYFFADRNYVEIRDKFKGKLSLPLMGAARNSLFKWLGNVKLKDDTWDAFEMAYGLLVLHYNKAGKVNLIQFTTRSAENLNLCE